MAVIAESIFCFAHMVSICWSRSFPVACDLCTVRIQCCTGTHGNDCRVFLFGLGVPPFHIAKTLACIADDNFSALLLLDEDCGEAYWACVHYNRCLGIFVKIAKGFCT